MAESESRQLQPGVFFSAEERRVYVNPAELLAWLPAVPRGGHLHGGREWHAFLAGVGWVVALVEVPASQVTEVMVRE